MEMDVSSEVNISSGSEIVLSCKKERNNRKEDWIS